MLAAVDKKVAGEEIVVSSADEPREQIIDLVAALKQSLSQKSADKGERKDERAAAKRKPAKAKGKKKAAAKSKPRVRAAS